MSLSFGSWKTLSYLPALSPAKLTAVCAHSQLRAQASSLLHVHTAMAASQWQGRWQSYFTGEKTVVGEVGLL